MPTSATERGRQRRRREAGFTLVELMVVLAIFGLASAAVVLAMPAGNTLRTDAERLAARARAAQEKAILDNRSVALRVDGAGYVFEQRQAGGWAALAPPFDGLRWEEATTAEGAGRIVFDPTGAGEPAEIVLGRGGARLTVSVAGDGGAYVRSPS